MTTTELLERYATGVDLNGVDLSGAVLTGINLNRGDLSIPPLLVDFYNRCCNNDFYYFIKLIVFIPINYE